MSEIQEAFATIRRAREIINDGWADIYDTPPAQWADTEDVGFADGEPVDAEGLWDEISGAYRSEMLPMRGAFAPRDHALLHAWAHTLDVELELIGLKLAPPNNDVVRQALAANAHDALIQAWSSLAACIDADRPDGATPSTGAFVLLRRLRSITQAEIHEYLEHLNATGNRCQGINAGYRDLLDATRGHRLLRGVALIDSATVLSEEFDSSPNKLARRTIRQTMQRNRNAGLELTAEIVADGEELVTPAAVYARFELARSFVDADDDRALQHLGKATRDLVALSDPDPALSLYRESLEDLLDRNRPLPDVYEFQTALPDDLPTSARLAALYTEAKQRTAHGRLHSALPFYDATHDQALLHGDQTWLLTTSHEFQEALGQAANFALASEAVIGWTAHPSVGMDPSYVLHLERARVVALEGAIAAATHGNASETYAALTNAVAHSVRLARHDLSRALDTFALEYHAASFREQGSSVWAALVTAHVADLQGLAGHTQRSLELRREAVSEATTAGDRDQLAYATRRAVETLWVLAPAPELQEVLDDWQRNLVQFRGRTGNLFNELSAIAWCEVTETACRDALAENPQGRLKIIGATGTELAPERELHQLLGSAAMLHAELLVQVGDDARSLGLLKDARRSFRTAGDIFGEIQTDRLIDRQRRIERGERGRSLERDDELGL